MTLPLSCAVTPEKLPGGTPSWVSPSRLYVVPANWVTPVVPPKVPRLRLIVWSPEPKLVVRVSAAAACVVAPATYFSGSVTPLVTGAASVPPPLGGIVIVLTTVAAPVPSVSVKVMVPSALTLGVVMVSLPLGVALVVVLLK